jgi:hypothetical protein
VVPEKWRARRAADAMLGDPVRVLRFCECFVIMRTLHSSRLSLHSTRCAMLSASCTSMMSTHLRTRNDVSLCARDRTPQTKIRTRCVCASTIRVAARERRLGDAAQCGSQQHNHAISISA